MQEDFRILRRLKTTREKPSAPYILIVHDYTQKSQSKQQFDLKPLTG